MKQIMTGVSHAINPHVSDCRKFPNKLTCSD